VHDIDWAWTTFFDRRKYCVLGWSIIKPTADRQFSATTVPYGELRTRMSIRFAVLAALVASTAANAFAEDRVSHHVQRSVNVQNKPSNDGIDPNNPAAEALRAMGRHGW